MSADRPYNKIDTNQNLRISLSEVSTQRERIERLISEIAATVMHRYECYEKAKIFNEIGEAKYQLGKVADWKHYLLTTDWVNVNEG